MSDQRIEALESFVQGDPDDKEARYMLGLEYRKAGRHDEALAALCAVIERFPDYFSAYNMGAQLLIELSRREEAREMLQKGAEVAQKAGDNHARDQMRDLLLALGE